MANIENMKLTLALLQRVKDDEMPFSLVVWRATVSDHLRHIITSGDPDHKCGFVACVGGWMGRDPAHNALGFSCESGNGSPLFNDGKETVIEFAAISRFWGVNETQARDVTAFESYAEKPTIDDAMNRLRELIDLHSLQHETAG